MCFLHTDVYHVYVYEYIYMADSCLSWEQHGHSHTHQTIGATSRAYFCGGPVQQPAARSWPKTDPLGKRCGPGSVRDSDNTKPTPNPEMQTPNPT